MKKLFLCLFALSFLLASCSEGKRGYDASSRRVYETDLRNAFLDEGYDIKVEVSGDDNDILTLTFPLFNDVWDRKFETQGTYKSLQDMGFKRVFLSDGYDYQHEEDLTMIIVDRI